MDLVLIHGAYHGAWCWGSVTPGLEQLGHRVATVDLPISRPGSGVPDYADAVDAGIDDAGFEAPGLVAHSMGGVVASAVAARRPVGRLIFVAGIVPSPGRTVGDLRADGLDGPTPPSVVEFTDLGGDLWMIGPTTARELFWHDASDELAAATYARLRPQSYRFMSEVPVTAWPDVPADYVVCRDDQTVNPDWGRRLARERFGTEAVEIDGGHSPMVTRPAELVAIIDRLARGR